MELPLAIGIPGRLVLEIFKGRAHHGVGAVDGLREEAEERYSYQSAPKERREEVFRVRWHSSIQ